jgi:ABC-type transport system involved in cytochrome c biogenesis permease subunit
MIINTTILSWVTFIYLGSAILYIFRMVTGKEFWGPPASFIALIGLIAQTFGLILRWFESYKMGIGHAPLSNLYESLIFFAWTIALLYLIIEWRIKSRNLGAFVIPFAFFSMAFASFSPNVKSKIQPLIPALPCNYLLFWICCIYHSMWPWIHVSFKRIGKRAEFKAFFKIFAGQRSLG